MVATVLPELYSLVVIFNDGTDLEDLFMTMWLLGGNLEPMRDVTIETDSAGNEIVFVDTTFKTESHDNFLRDWPNVVTMDEKTISSIDKKWNELGLGEFIQSPSMKYIPLVKGAGAVRE
jgi:4-hydroxy-3-polyprenylbenzoate decarboxylase